MKCKWHYHINETMFTRLRNKACSKIETTIALRDGQPIIEVVRQQNGCRTVYCTVAKGMIAKVYVIQDGLESIWFRAI